MSSAHNANHSETLYNYLRGIDWQTASKQPYLDNHTSEKKQLLLKIAASNSGRQILVDLLTYANQMEWQRKRSMKNGYNLFTVMDEKSDNEWIIRAVQDAIYYADKLAPVRNALPEVFAAESKEDPLKMLKR